LEIWLGRIPLQKCKRPFYQHQPKYSHEMVLCMNFLHPSKFLFHACSDNIIEHTDDTIRVFAKIFETINQQVTNICVMHPLFSETDTNCFLRRVWSTPQLHWLSKWHDTNFSHKTTSLKNRTGKFGDKSVKS